MTPDQQVRQHILDAKADLTDALGHLQRLLPRTTTLSRAQPTGDPGCTSCRTAGTYSPTKDRAGGLCWWCYEWKQAHHAMPPIGVLDARSQGRRITTRVVEHAAAAERHNRKPKGRKRKAS